MFMDYDKLKILVEKLKSVYNLKEIDIGALEPFLHPNIIKIMKMLDEQDIVYNVTTNGSLLNKFENELKTLKNLAKIRISLYTLRKDFFNRCSNNNKFDIIIKNILNLKNYINVEINCLVLKGYEKDAIDVVNFALENNLKVKLYNLYYMPQYEKEFKKYFIRSEEMLSFFFKNIPNAKIDYYKKNGERDRIVLKVKDQEIIIKNEKSINRDNDYCKNCKYVNFCNENFAEYIRVDPDFYFYPCYLRKDLRFNIFDEKIFNNLKLFNKELNIRLIVSGVCNFRCSFENGTMWCLKQGGNYIWRKL